MAATLPPGGTDFWFIPIVPLKGKDTKIEFRAFINSINESFSPNWGEHMDMGRADPKVMYNQFSRHTSLDFKIIALNRGEHVKNMEAMNSLSQLTYPIYKRGMGFNGIYVNMVVGKYLNAIGFINSLSFSVDNESPWVDDIPLYIDCSLEFKYIGNKKPYYKQNSMGPFNTGNYGQGIK